MIKKDMFPELDPAGWELHAYDVWNNCNFFAEEKLKLDFVKKQEIFSKVVDFVCESKLVLIGVVMLKDRIKDAYANPEVMEWSWSLMTECFERFLKQQEPKTNSGLFLVDSSQKIPESEIRGAIWRRVREGGSRQSIDHVVANSIFVKSNLENLIQLADMIAYITHKHYRDDPQFKGWFERLHLQMYRSGGQCGSGINEFPVVEIE